MKILALGDIVGAKARDVICKNLWTWRKEVGADFVVANAENVCCGNGNGLDRDSALALLQAGVDCITTGNHVFRKHNLHALLEDSTCVLRPANYPDRAPGSGVCILTVNGWRVLVLNLLGQVYLDPIGDPFDTADRILARYDGDYDCAIVDFHAEATGEKAALAHHLDGKVAVFFGTHTHVQTNDARILPNGTGFLSDLGMCGPSHSILGVKVDCVVHKLREKLPTLFEVGDGETDVRGALFDIDPERNRTTAVTLFCKTQD